MSDLIALRRREAELVAKLQGRRTGEINMHNRAQFEAAATKFFQQNLDQSQKYLGPDQLRMVVDNMQLPSVVSAKIAFDALVANGTLTRTDGKHEADDIVADLLTSKANLERVIAETEAQPLTAEFLEEIASLDPRTLSARYWEDEGLNTFACKYRRAIRDYGFVEPARVWTR